FCPGNRVFELSKTRFPGQKPGCKKTRGAGDLRLRPLAFLGEQAEQMEARVKVPMRLETPPSPVPAYLAAIALWRCPQVASSTPAPTPTTPIITGGVVVRRIRRRGVVTVARRVVVTTVGRSGVVTVGWSGVVIGGVVGGVTWRVVAAVTRGVGVRVTRVI